MTFDPLGVFGGQGVCKARGVLLQLRLCAIAASPHNQIMMSFQERQNLITIRRLESLGMVVSHT